MKVQSSKRMRSFEDFVAKQLVRLFSLSKPKYSGYYFVFFKSNEQYPTACYYNQSRKRWYRTQAHIKPLSVNPMYWIYRTRTLR